ncbi:heme oxygenase [Sphingomonas spermidinifaciens]|uniref:Heme oxygenase n=1 Tax=Sphingomonas spermidinifaciens TaxID=1141889 RepID=A0A2A4B4H3_9SPHN|nr:biliverdin-producing heme oxygenase [Sphingomonas spermidinifaciens]PCD02566.1 heme oxygenase [Sphingomonas spermidinifaciens]
MRDAHRLLRDATREAHERLDAQFAGFDLATRDGYAGFIGAQASAMMAVEAALDAAGAERVIDDWPARRRSDALRRDAAALGIEPHPLDPPALAGEAAIAGALYVVEGSRHGARFLRRQVADGLPTAFLDADQAPGSWPKLLDRIDPILYQPEAEEAAIRSALDIFDLFATAGRVWMKA